jgi:hypothetical protein
MMAFLRLLRRMGRDDLTAHGFCSTFRDRAAEPTNFSNEVVELALAHAIGDKVEAACLPFASNSAPAQRLSRLAGPCRRRQPAMPSSCRSRLRLVSYSADAPSIVQIEEDATSAVVPGVVWKPAFCFIGPMVAVALWRSPADASPLASQAAAFRRIEL